jgi:hypothetical protein
MNIISLFIGQDGGGVFDFIWLLLPFLCCLMAMGPRGEKPQESGRETELFYNTQGINKSFEEVEKEVDNWIREAREDKKDPQGVLPSLRRLLGERAPPERFVEIEKNPPRLYSLEDPTGPIYFEFTEVEGGGTVVKATFDFSLKEKVAKLKAGLPLKIPSTPVGLKCPSCGQSILQEYNLCPYCGSELIKE